MSGVRTLLPWIAGLLLANKHDIKQLRSILMTVSKEITDLQAKADASIAASDAIETKLAQVRADLAALVANSVSLSADDKQALIDIGNKLDTETADATTQAADQPGD
jgi:hypothetical protein